MRRIVTFRDETRSHLEFRQRDVVDGMRSLSKLHADVVSKSFQELIIFTCHWALRHPLWPSRLASSSSWFLRGFLHPSLHFMLVAGVAICGVGFIEYLATLLLKFVGASGSHRGAEGDGDGCASSLLLFPAQYNKRCPLLPVQRRSAELPATTVGEWRRRHSLRRHKGGLWTVLLIFVHHVVLQGGFKKLVRNIPERPEREPACVVDCGGSVVTSEGTSPNRVGGVIQPGRWRSAWTPHFVTTKIGQVACGTLTEVASDHNCAELETQVADQEEQGNTD